MATDLHTQLGAAIDRLEVLAKAVQDPIALRGVAEDRDILRRHTPTTAAGYGWYCAGCSIVDHDENVVALVPMAGCRELPSLARRHGIEVA